MFCNATSCSLARIYQRSEGIRWHYLAQSSVSMKSLAFPLVSPTFRGFQQYAVLEYRTEERSLRVESGDRGGISIGPVQPIDLCGKRSSDMALELEFSLCLSRVRTHAHTHTHTQT